MILLVTGGAGFIGSNFIKHILKETGWRVVNLDKLTYAGNLENLADVEDNSRYSFVRGDITDSELLKDLFKHYDFNMVINFAAESHVDRSIENSAPFINTNILGTQMLLDTACKHGVKKFLQVSTDEVYGSLDDGGFFTEGTPLAPNSPYSASKASADLLCRAYFKTHGLQVVITRCSNNFGPYQFPEKLIPLVVTNALEGRPIPVYGDGMNVRDWIYVLDHCEALRLVLDKGRAGEIYNIGGGARVTNLSLVKMILDILGKPETLITFVGDRPGHDRRYAVDPAKIMDELGWRRGYDFKEAMHKTVAWYLENEGWWRRIKSGEYLDYYNRWYGKLAGEKDIKW
ncbi:dTDP-glucose 4,6-dehydratase [Pelotomaculum sp. PtaB.Bin117]|uniref:dTDP-glucose 4,6-dehydratase n=1 Tax=Pelotomaculum sp. PtaB.Bin117 TaxID=1811694 RepID=UPI0009D02857|nr:dTDP-glucose 4,6-dehydratase [Pelotomaculum sp. PtaB.Bin117]OPX89001.1 MAG: dTDP-glucose 4,6-dehydratase [Pelotomaculum sp. PtaB.Bin117]